MFRIIFDFFDKTCAGFTCWVFGHTDTKLDGYCRHCYKALPKD